MHGATIKITMHDI